MPRPGELRAFIYLGPKELDFVRALQRLVQRKLGRKRPPPLHAVIRGALRDYQLVLEVVSRPEFLKAYESVRSRYRPSRAR